MHIPCGYSTAFKLLSYCQKVPQVQSLLHTRGWPAPVCSFIKLLQIATLQTGSTTDVDACSDNELVEVENHKNEVRFKSADGNLYCVGGGKLVVATYMPLASISLFSVVFYSACSKT